MIIKFKCSYDQNTSIEIEQNNFKEVRISIDDEKEQMSVFLTDKQIYSLIGQLLLIQSEMKKGGKNG
jgi:hypothetical protein